MKSGAAYRASTSEKGVSSIPQGVISDGDDTSHHSSADIFNVVRSIANNAIVEGLVFADMDWMSIHERAAILDCSKHFIAIRIVNNTHERNFLGMNGIGEEYVLSHTNRNYA